MFFHQIFQLIFFNTWTLNDVFLFLGDFVNNTHIYGSYRKSLAFSKRSSAAHPNGKFLFYYFYALCYGVHVLDIVWTLKLVFVFFFFFFDRGEVGSFLLFIVCHFPQKLWCLTLIFHWLYHPLCIIFFGGIFDFSAWDDSQKSHKVVHDHRQVHFCWFTVTGSIFRCNHYSTYA